VVLASTPAAAATASYWQREGADTALQVTNPPASADIAVIGGGLAGVSSALAVLDRQPGARVVVLEQKFVGYGASGRNGGLLSPLPVPVWLLTADKNEDHAWALRTLNRKLHRLGAWLAETVPESEIAPCTLHLQATGHLTTAGLGVIAQTLDRSGIDHRMIQEPGRNSRPTLTLPTFTVHPYRLVRALAARAIAKGALVCEQAAVAGIEPLPSGSVRVRLADGKLVEAGRVLVCTNAYTHALSGPPVPRAKVVRNYMVETDVLDEETVARLGSDQTFIVELNKSYIFYRLHQRRLIYGGVETFFGAAKSDYEVPAAVLRKLEKHLAHSMRWRPPPAIASAWGGNFHSTATDLPIIRTAAQNREVSFNIGYGGTGVALTQLFAPQAASLILGQPCGDDDDARIARTVASTRVPLGGLLRLGGRVVHNIVTGKTAARSG
jgi:glycine/D-amino acid oxidase-like deaminating enzyme